MINSAHEKKKVKNRTIKILRRILLLRVEYRALLGRALSRDARGPQWRRGAKSQVSTIAERVAYY